MKSVCRVVKNDIPAKFTGNYFRWICDTPEGKIYCDTRDCARIEARNYNKKRKSLLRDFRIEQARQEFYN